MKTADNGAEDKNRKSKKKFISSAKKLVGDIVAIPHPRCRNLFSSLVVSLIPKQ